MDEPRGSPSLSQNMSPSPKDARVVGLDSLRFVAALWVVFSHIGGFPLVAGADRGEPIGLLVQGIYGNLFAGPAAVMVFFVISGFCIHFPQVRSGSFEPLPYFARRYLRIGIPLVVAIYLARPLAVNLQLFQNSILWTLVAELIYYTLYPLLRRLKELVGWHYLIGISFIAAIATVLRHPDALDYTPFGNSLNWIIGLPTWLLGCQLAENISAGTPPPISFNRIWCWRFGIWFFASVASVLRFHSPVGYPWTLLAFSLLVYFWLQREIAFFRIERPPRALEWAGQWSYSIYLIHLVAATAYVHLVTPDLGVNLNWLMKFAWILAGCFAFFLFVENPAHWLARRISRRLRRPKLVAP